MGCASTGPSHRIIWNAHPINQDRTSGLESARDGRLGLGVATRILIFGDGVCVGNTPYQNNRNNNKTVRNKTSVK